MNEPTEGDLMALQSQWVELQASAREWLMTTEEQRKARHGSGDVSLTSDARTGEDGK